MEEELKKLNDFKKTQRSILLKIYRNTSNGVTTQYVTVFITGLICMFVLSVGYSPGRL